MATLEVSLRNGDLFSGHGTRFEDGNVCIRFDWPDAGMRIHAPVKVVPEFVSALSGLVETVLASEPVPVPNYVNVAGKNKPGA